MNNYRKELINQYKNRKIIGGVFIIRNQLKNKSLLDTATDLQGSKNRFEFTQKTGSCADLRLQNDWIEQNGRHFVFEVLEELEKSNAQTESEFKKDLDILKEIWHEKLVGEDFY